MNTALSSLVLAALLSQGMSSCTYRQGRREITAFGRTRYLCDFDILSNGSRSTMTFEFGSKFSTADCTECECTADGMRCCGFGIKAGPPIYAPAGCHVVADGCTPRIVRMSDNRTDCYAQGVNRRFMNPNAGRFEALMMQMSGMNPNGMFGVGAMNPMGPRGGQAGGGEMGESEGLLPMSMLLPLLMGSFGDIGAGGMAGTEAPPSGNPAAGTGAGVQTGAQAGAQTGDWAMDPFQSMGRMPPLMRGLLLSSLFSS